MVMVKWTMIDKPSDLVYVYLFFGAFKHFKFSIKNKVESAVRK